MLIKTGIYLICEKSMANYQLLYDFAPGSKIMPCNKTGKRYDVHNNVAYIMTK